MLGIVCFAATLAVEGYAIYLVIFPNDNKLKYGIQGRWLLAASGLHVVRMKHAHQQAYHPRIAVCLHAAWTVDILHTTLGTDSKLL